MPPARLPRRWVFSQALGVGNGGVAEEACHVIGAYSMLGDVDIVHDHSMVGPIYALSVPSPPVVTTNHGPFNEILTPVYRAISQRTPVIAISNHQASEARSASRSPRSSTTASTSSGYRSAPARAATPRFSAACTRTRGSRRRSSAARAAGMPLRIAAKMTELAEREYFNTRVAPHLGGDIEYVGELGRLEKYDLLKDAVCLLNPIRWAEPFGMVMIEAMACGTPVVTNDRGSAPEIVDDGDTGFLCDDESSLVAVAAQGRQRSTAPIAGRRLSNGSRLVGWQLTTSPSIAVSSLARRIARTPITKGRQPQKTSTIRGSSTQPSLHEDVGVASRD